MDSSDFIDGEPISDKITLVKMKYWEPYPKNPVMVDFHDNGVIDCISQKIYHVLRSMNIEGIQMIPATISDPRNHHIYDNYYYLHIYNQIECLDMDNSQYRVGRIGKIRSISRMRLSHEKLEKIPLNKRLVFRLGEMNTFQLVHESVVNTIMASDPQDIRFVKVEDYNAGAAFD